MGSLIQAILKLLSSLFGGGTSSSDQTRTEPSPAATEVATTFTASSVNDADTDCSIPADLEQPPVVSYENVKEVKSFFDAFTFGLSQQEIEQARVASFSAQAATCKVVIRPELGSVNLRLGPGRDYEPPIASTQGGTEFELVGAAAPFNESQQWFALKLGNTSGWVRGDLINFGTDCSNVSYLPGDVQIGVPPVTTSSGALFAPPTTAAVTQGYNPPKHPGIDMGAQIGTPLVSPASGLVIRRIECETCYANNRSKPNIFPCGNAIYKDIKWGYGYGNFLVMRYDYAVLPRDLQKEMENSNLKGGFAYLLFAHMDRLDVGLGQRVSPGQTLGVTGNTGCSSGPHLHFEVRIGNVSEVDGKWSLQTAVNPKLMFRMV